MNVFYIKNIVITHNRIKYYLLSEQLVHVTYVTDLPFNDYFFANKREIDILETAFPNVKFKFHQLDDNYKFVEFRKRDHTVYKVELPTPYMKNKMRIKMEEEHNILLSEADIPYIDLLFKELNMGLYIKIENGNIIPVKKPDDFPELRVAYVDYETDDRPEILAKSEFDTFAKPDVSRILSCSITNSKGETKHFVHDNERKLLIQIRNELVNYDIIQWWNGRNFDSKFDMRYKLNNISGYDPKMWIRLDAMIIHEMLNNKERGHLSLDMIAKRYLGVRKIQHKWSFYEAFLNYREELEVYNNRDTELMYQLENKFNFASIVLSTAEKIGFLPQRYTYSRYSSIQAIMRLSMDHYGKRFVWKSKSMIPLSDAYEGAIVFESMKGVWGNVLGIDLKSLYNNIIQTWNISNEQLFIYKDGTHDYSRFNQEGIMPRALRIFEVEREEMKALRDSVDNDEDYNKYNIIQGGLKIILLSIYGGLGARGSTKAKEGQKPSGAKSFYSWRCANDVTKYARMIILDAKEVVEDMGYTIVYGDTDSLYIFIGSEPMELQETIKIMYDIVSNINKKYNIILEEQGVPEHRRKIKMEAQGWYSPFVLFGKKKMYFAKEIYNAENNKLNTELKIYSKGVKMSKISEPKFIRDFQKKIYTCVLEGTPYNEFIDLIKETQDNFYRGKYDDDLVFETKITKFIRDYTNMPPHIVLAKKLIESGKMAEKTTIFYIIKDVFNGTAIAGEESDRMTHSGRKYIWNNRIRSWLKEIEELAYISKFQSNLDDFF